MKGKSSKQVSDDTQRESRSWKETKDGEELNIYLDLLSQEEYDRVQRRLNEGEDVVARIFCGAV